MVESPLIIRLRVKPSSNCYKMRLIFYSGIWFLPTHNQLPDVWCLLSPSSLRKLSLSISLHTNVKV